MKFGVTYTQLDGLVDPVSFAEQVELWGYDSFWVPDFALTDCLEPLTTLAAVAQATSELTLGTAVLVLPYHHPVRLAKSIATLDRLSNGRLTVGVGVGGRADEFAAMGMEIQQRGKLSTERLSLLRRLLAGEAVSHSGNYHQLDSITVRPRPIQSPHPPMWTGPVWRDGFAGSVLDRTALLADGFLPTLVPAEGYRTAQNAIRRAADRAGRDLSTFEWSLLMWIGVHDNRDKAWQHMSVESHRRGGTDEAKRGHANAIGTPRDCIEAIEAYRALGVSHLVLDVGAAPELMMRQYERFALEVMPHFRS